MARREVRVLAADAAVAIRRRRGAATDPAHHHSRMVRTLRLALPLSAVGLLAALAAWPTITAVGNGVGGMVDPGRTEVTNARFYGRDADRPFSVTAETVVRDNERTPVSHLIAPTAEWTLETGSWVSMTADHGRYDEGSGRLWLETNVHIVRDDGLEFLTDQAEIDTRAGTARGQAPVTGQGPAGAIQAEGFEMLDRGQRVRFGPKSGAVITDTDRIARR